MARDKGKDDKLFNCAQQHEIDYVANQYTSSQKVREQILNGCRNGTIKNWTHKQLYDWLAEKGLK